VAEIAVYSIRRGGGSAELRTWLQPNAVVCQIADSRVLTDPLVGARAPVTREDENRGLWLANQISDLVQIRSTAQGSLARVFAWR